MAFRAVLPSAPTACVLQAVLFLCVACGGSGGGPSNVSNGAPPAPPIAARTLLVDFGASEGQTVINAEAFPGLHQIVTGGLQYGSLGGRGGLLVTASEHGSFLKLVSSAPKYFAFGERIIVTVHTGGAFLPAKYPLISFDDPDCPDTSSGRRWWAFRDSTEGYAPGGVLECVYDISNAQTVIANFAPSEGSHAFLNICLNTRTGVLIDKIELAPADRSVPPPVTGVAAEALSPSSLRLTWNAAVDTAGGDGIAKVKIYVDQLYTLYADKDATSKVVPLLEPSRTYTLQVSAVDRNGNEGPLSQAVHCSTSGSQNGLLNPANFVYRGAFTCGAPVNINDIAFHPGGDPANQDAYPGSLFIPRHKQETNIFEASIPVPVVSASKALGDLTSASILQPSTNLAWPNLHYGGGDLQPPAVCYLGPQGSQTQGYLYVTFGDKYAGEVTGGPRLDSFGACTVDFAHPAAYGGWILGPASTNVDPSYTSTIISLFDTPYPVKGHRLVACGKRPTDKSNLGPQLIAFSPWNDGSPLPSAGAELGHLPLLMYDLYGGSSTFPSYHYNDEWQGGAWLQAGGKEAVVISGNKGFGDEWYGYNNGETHAHRAAHIPYPGVPVAGENKGQRSSRREPLLLFYDPAELLQVADGLKAPSAPQPYAIWHLQSHLFVPNENSAGGRTPSIGGIAYDRANGFVYLLEKGVYGTYLANPIIHVFKVE